MQDYWLYWIGLDSYTEKYIQVFWEVGWEKNQFLPTPVSKTQKSSQKFILKCQSHNQ